MDDDRQVDSAAPVSGSTVTGHESFPGSLGRRSGDGPRSPARQHGDPNRRDLNRGNPTDIVDIRADIRALPIVTDPESWDPEPSRPASSADTGTVAPGIFKRFRRWLLILVAKLLFEEVEIRPRSRPRGNPASNPQARADDGGNRRRHRRVAAGANRVRVDGRVYQLFDISLGGFSFGPADDYLIPDQRFYFEIGPAGEPQTTVFRADAVIVRIRDGRFAAAFFFPFSATRRRIAELVGRNSA